MGWKARGNKETEAKKERQRLGRGQNGVPWRRDASEARPPTPTHPLLELRG